ncbi:transmembrane 220 family protein [Maribacter sp. HTCC2170]|uniref:transmembrane 220 family protein n=1 Tax=Maribacter sp. (strain HTCC2170 / KCCM 42371) TaxID=313603 RepID=UPI00006B4724|nr:transmembrane 220 family protein [Maribacter sp. HTCC2170]EAR01888.1 hypothetical protein FB2170_15208 [Maribacter sp. HTCC2170]
MEKVFKFSGSIFSVLFLITAGLQYNDPDPALWISIYLIATVVTLGYVFNKVSFFIPAIFGVLALIGFFYLMPETFEGFTIGQGDIKNIEEAREAFGLLITAIVMFMFALRIRFKNKSS